MGTTTGEFIATLTAAHDVIVIGGLAVIAHGLNRPTQDADIWLRPMDSAEAWAGLLVTTCARFPDLKIQSLPGWREVRGLEVAVAADDVGMIRISGLDCPLDIFRRPNEFPEDAFDEVLSRATRNSDGTWLPDPLDLAISKTLSGREKDEIDIRFLESLVRQRWIERLPTADIQEAREFLDRFADWRTCASALSNPEQAVRELASSYLREFAAEGDPFSQALLDGREIPQA